MRRADYFFFALVAFLCGIFIAAENFIGFTLLCFVLTILGATAFFYTRRLRYSVLFFLILGGFFYFYLYSAAVVFYRNIPFGQKLEFRAIVVDEAKFSEKSQYFTARLEEPFSGEIRIVTSQIPEYMYGDEVEGAGVIREESVYEGKLPSAIFPSLRKAGEHRGFFLREKLIGLKHAVIAGFEDILPGDAAALLSGILLGSLPGLNADLKDAMAKSGTTHLVALSGYNITILVLAVSFVVRRFFSRTTTFYLTLIIIAVFVLMAGASASIVRAALMGFLVLFGEYVGRLYNIRNAITLSAFLMVLFDPYLLTFDLGFILSFLSLLGVVYVKPVLAFYLRPRSRGSQAPALDWRDQFITTASAQLAVIPVLMASFGQFSASSFLANLFILEFVPVTMFAGFVLALTQFVFAPLAFILGKIIFLILAYELWIIHFFAVLPIPLPLVLGSSVAIVLYYGIFAMLVYMHRSNIKTVL